MALSLRSPDVLAVIAALAAYALWRAYRLLSFVFQTPLRNLPGPRASSWVYGNLKDVAAVENSFLPDRWFEQYGKHYVDHEFFMTPRLWTLDPRAIQHVLTHNDDYARPEESRRILIEVMGRGILFVQGEEHRQQRRILNPAFGPAQVRDLTEIFVRKSLELRDIWASATADRKPYEVNVSQDLSRMTLDVIGLAGFNYDFNALDPSGKPSELNIAFRNLFSNTASFSLLSFLRAWFPVLKIIPNKRARVAQKSSEVFKRVGKNLVVDMKESVMRDVAKKHRDGVERSDLKSRDLLTLLIKANMAKDLPASQRLSDADVIGQIPTFLLAGHETTSTSTTWALYALSTHPSVQTKLREELLAVQTDTPTMEELSALPYLDGVVRETLRLHAPITMLIREAKKDDSLPVSEPYTDRFGKVHTDIPIAKGNKVVVPILAVHRSKELWGEDVLEFKPERWAQPPEAISVIPGVWGHLLTFTGGPRACIGYRFSLIEMKAILFSLIRAFEFKLAVPAEDIYIKSAPLQRPMVRSAQEQGFQLPLIITPYKTA